MKRIIKYLVILIVFFVLFITFGTLLTQNQKASYVNRPDVASNIPRYTNRFNRVKPIIAIVGENSFTELTDYVVPYGILAESKVADVYALATQVGNLKMFPALEIEPQASIQEFDQKFVKGADYVIVPAVHYTDDPILRDWVLSQADKGATIVGICDGVKVLARAGLLKNRDAVGHWFSFDALSKEFPETTWLKDIRYLADKNVITTTGVTASIPVSLALVEAIAGTEKAIQVAQVFGLNDWNAGHNSDEFSLNARHGFTAASNWLSFWGKEIIGLPIENGVDEIDLAISADALSRTYKSKAYSFALLNTEPIVSKRGLVIMPDIMNPNNESIDRTVVLNKSLSPEELLEQRLSDIEHWYGKRTADFVALQLEYPRVRENLN